MLSKQAVPIHDVKPNLNRAPTSLCARTGSGTFTNLGFNGLRLDSAACVGWLPLVSGLMAAWATDKAALVA